MILKAFKEKSNQKFVDKTLSNRNVIAKLKKAESIGVLLNYSEYCDYDVINSFLDKLDITSAKRKIFTYISDKNTEHSQWDNVFTAKDFGWKGKLKNSDLKNFTETNFDVLICYFLANDNELKQIAAMSSADLKVGISNTDERLYDLIIDVDTKNFDVFKTELKKYLTILNKI
ncbi:DUF6913 domain-containing protein [Winogradskyella jejuensis]|uniref:Uncharacterized protein n=1 Tax=Winogradskyella jejuensis TaxID=1089305 RepID=A0A1M5VPH8_9FLAO|nr:hypothetical protein [Winogradskyella jejuensis]SHH77152.1 hypothetical protein SAMN05444148_2778 [Winogradskyella jejuensis]